MWREHASVKLDAGHSGLAMRRTRFIVVQDRTQCQIFQSFLASSSSRVFIKGHQGWRIGWRSELNLPFKTTRLKHGLMPNLASAAGTAGCATRVSTARMISFTNASSWDEVSQLFGWLGSRFCNCIAYRFDLLAAGVSGDLASYTVGYEYTSVSMDGVLVELYTLRVTHVYRCENGAWKIVHRHSHAVPIDQSPPTEASTT